jgi:AGCS family alanine or glycine:cation symporter
MPFFLLIVGFVFGLKYKFFYIFHPIKTFKTILINQKGGFKSLSLALAATLGVGNIVGVSSAICMGGYGAIFWMWVSAICAMSLKYAEVFLAMKYREKTASGFKGGAPNYIFGWTKK